MFKLIKFLTITILVILSFHLFAEWVVSRDFMSSWLSIPIFILALSVFAAEGEAKAMKAKQAQLTPLYIDYIKASNWPDRARK